MATWMVHLRVADRFLDRVEKERREEFLVGSVAPDCGYGSKDSFSGFIPPTSTTHWTPTGRKNDIDIDRFFDTYLKNADCWGDAAFYLGYLIHLLTDIKWGMGMYLPTKIKYREQYKQNPEFLLEIKKDWNDLDYRFIAENPDFRGFKKFCRIGEISDYLPYYEHGQLKTQCDEIIKYYKEYKDGRDLWRDYKYLTPERQNRFVEQIYQTVEQFLVEIGIIQEEELC